MKKYKNEDIIAVYRPTAASQIMGFGMLVLMIFIIPALTKTLIDSHQAYTFESRPMVASLMIGIVFAFVVAMRYLFLLTRDKLLIQADGMTWWYRGRKSSVAWDMLERTGDHDIPFSKDTTRWGIFTNNRHFIPIDYYIALPSFKIFASEQEKLKKLRDTEAGEIIYRYAPHLFDDLKKKKADAHIDGCMMPSHRNEHCTRYHRAHLSYWMLSL